jgi:hypothetical protein
MFDDLSGSATFKDSSVEERKELIEKYAKDNSVTISDYLIDKIANLNPFKGIIIDAGVENLPETAVGWETYNDVFASGDEDNFALYITEDYKKAYDEIVEYNNALYRK